MDKHDKMNETNKTRTRKENSKPNNQNKNPCSQPKEKSADKQPTMNTHQKTHTNNKKKTNKQAEQPKKEESYGSLQSNAAIEPTRHEHEDRQRRWAMGQELPQRTKTTVRGSSSLPKLKLTHGTHPQDQDTTVRQRSRLTV